MVSTETLDSAVSEDGADKESDEPLAALVQELARHCNANEPHEMQQGQQVVLDLEVGDLRCVLIRLNRRKKDSISAVTLSPRELEIARMIAQGYPNKIIADVLDISSWTVGTHVRHLFAKLNVTSRAAMVAKIAQSLPHDKLARSSRNKNNAQPDTMAKSSL